jgi:hypothetical protein
VGASVLMAFAALPASSADEIHVASLSVMPAPMSPELRLRGSFSGPRLTNDLLAAYVSRQLALKSFSIAPATQLTEEVLLGYIARNKPNMALAAIDSFAVQPALNSAVLQTYATKSFIPTVKKLKIANSERLCLTQAIYH